MPKPDSDQSAPEDDSGRAMGPWLIVLGAALWGTTGTAQALAPPGAEPLAVGALRQLLGAVGLFLLAFWRGGHGALALQRWPWRATVLAGLCMAAYQLCFFSAVARTGVAVGTVVGIGSAPIAGGLIGWLLRAERPGWRWAAGTALGLAGCAILMLAGGAVTINGLGLALAVTAGAAYALYAHFSKTLLTGRAPDLVMAMVFAVGAVFLLPVLLSFDLRWVAQMRGALVVLHLGLVATALAYALFARGLREVSVAMAMTLTLTEPLTAAVLGLALLREPVTLSVAAGLLCMLLGLLILALWPRPGLARRFAAAGLTEPPPGAARPGRQK